MSSSRSRWSSVPKRLGHGMTRRTRMSVSPRKAAHREEREDERLADAPAVVVVEPVEDGRAGQDGDEGRDPRQPAELVRKLGVGLGELRGDGVRQRPGAGLSTVAMRRRLSADRRQDPLAAASRPSEVERSRRYHRPIYVSLRRRARARARDAGAPLGVRRVADRAVVARSAAFRVRSPSRSRRSSGCR